MVGPQSKAMVRLRKRIEEETWEGQVFGSSQFWQDIQQAYEDFRILGEPQKHMYHLVVEKEGPSLMIGSLRLPLEQ